MKEYFHYYLEALEDMYFFHQDQLDKNGQFYFYHPLRVAAHFLEINDIEAAVVAALHDVIEDTSCSIGYIAEKYPDEIVDAVVAITKRENETYRQYIKRCCENNLAMKVKKQDLLDNLSDDRYNEYCPVDRYYRALGYIYELEHKNPL